MVLQTRIFFLVNHFSRTRKKIRVCRTTFLEPDVSNQISKNCKMQKLRAQNKKVTVFCEFIWRQFIKNGQSDFQREISMSRIIGILLLFLSIKNNSLEAYFCKNFFFITLIFEPLYFLKAGPNSC